MNAINPTTNNNATIPPTMPPINAAFSFDVEIGTANVVVETTTVDVVDEIIDSSVPVVSLAAVGKVD